MEPSPKFTDLPESHSDLAPSLTSDWFYLIRLDEASPGYLRQRLAYAQSYHLWLLVEAGTGCHTIDQMEYAVDAGQLHYVRPGQVHSWSFSRNTTAYLLFLRGPLVDSVSHTMGPLVADCPVCSLDFRSGILARLFRQVHQLVTRPGPPPPSLAERLTSLLRCLESSWRAVERNRP